MNPVPPVTRTRRTPPWYPATGMTPAAELRTPEQAPVVPVAVGVDLAALDGGPHRAAGLPVVPTVAEATSRRRGLDLGEDIRDGILIVEQRQLANPGCVRQVAAVRKRVELAQSGGVPSLAQLLTHGGGAGSEFGIHRVQEA